MLKKRRLLRIVALMAGLSLFAAACGDDDEEADETTTTEAAAGEEKAPTCEGESDGTLTFGTILPQTGNLAFLGPPEFAGAELAKMDINEAGGVLGKDIVVRQGDSGDAETDIASQTVDRHLEQGADVIVGAASSGVSFTVIDKITGACKIQFSPANTSPDFTTYDDDGLYFRTAPSDVLQGRVLGNLILEEGNTTAGLMALQDPYGEGLLKFTRETLAEQGVEVVEDFVYDPKAPNFNAEVDRIASADPEAIVIIGFEESSKILQTFFERGLTKDEKNFYLVDGNIGNALGEKFDEPGVLEDIVGSLPTAEVPTEFRDRLLEVDPELIDFSYGPETYDAIVITALAAEIAGSDDPTKIAPEVNGVTREGTKCSTFEECRDLIEDGDDIDYDGPSGPQTFGPAGEPTEASFAFLRYGADNQIDEDRTEYKRAKL